MIAVGKLKSVWLKQLSTVNSVKNVCYAYEVMQDAYTRIDRMNT
jgi:hypothetical protein